MMEIMAAKDKKPMQMPTMEQIINGMKKMMKPMEANPDDAIASFIAEHPDCRLLMNAKTHEAAIKAGLELTQERIVVSEHVEGGRIYLVAKEMATPRIETL